MYQLYVPVIIAPPTQPIDLTTTSIQSTTVTITWSQPSDTGGRSDIFYTVMIEGDDNIPRALLYINLTSLMVSDLTPATKYNITVAAKNGVSSQSASLRSVDIIVITLESGIYMMIIMCIHLCMREFWENLPLTH